MSSLADEYELSQYRELEPLDKNKRVYIVKDIRDNKIWVKKEVSKSSAHIYSRLKEINSKNIAGIKQVLNIENKYYVIEEYIEGVELSRLLKQRGVLDCDSVKSIMCQICDGLNSVHKKGMIHRDISPSNIIIKNNGDVCLIDFGISRIKKENVSRDTVILGTAGFAAPEQFGFKQTEAEADIYSCGVLMNLMLTGELPSEKRHKGKMDYIINRCLSMDSKNRYSSAEELKYAVINSEGKTGRLIDHLGKAPGFRSGKNLNSLIAVIIYILFAAFMALGLCCIAVTTIGEGMRFIILAVFCILIPFWLAADYMNYIERLPVIKNQEAVLKKFFGILLGFLCFTVSLVILLFWVKNI